MHCHGSGIFDSIAHLIGLGKHHEVDERHGAGMLDSVLHMFGLGRSKKHLAAFHAMHGSGLFDSLAHLIGLGRSGAGWMDWAHKAAQIAAPLARASGNSTLQSLGNAAGAFGYGRRKGAGWMDFAKKAAAIAAPLARASGNSTLQSLGNAAGAFGYGRAPSKRGAIVRQVMCENPGMSLPQASRYVKENGLYK